MRVPASKVTSRWLLLCGSEVTSNSAGSTSTTVKSTQFEVSDEHAAVMRYSSSSPGRTMLRDAVFTSDNSPSAAAVTSPATVVVDDVPAGAETPGPPVGAASWLAAGSDVVVVDPPGRSEWSATTRPPGTSVTTATQPTIATQPLC